MYNLLTYLQTHFYQLILVVPFLISILFDCKLDDNFRLFCRCGRSRDFQWKDPDRQIPYQVCFMSLGLWTILIYNSFESIKRLETNSNF